MKYFSFPLFLFLAFLMSCTPSSPSEEGNERTRGGIDRNDEEYDRRRERDSDRDDVIDRSRKRHTGGAKCEGNDDCEEMCDDIYDRRRDKEDCEDLSVRQVELLKDVYELLEDPDLDDLEGIDLEDLDVLINISIEPLDDRVGKYSRREAKEMLVWIASSSAVANLFEKEDDDFKILKKLLGEINSDSLSALKATLDSGDSFMEIAVEESNEEAALWIHDFMEEELCSGNVESAACLQKYCDLARAMNNDPAKDMLDFEFFEEYLENIVEEGVNGNEWARGRRTTGDGNTAAKTNHKDCDTTLPFNDATADCEPFEDLDDLEDEWWEELCAGDPLVPGNT